MNHAHTFIRTLLQFPLSLSCVLFISMASSYGFGFSQYFQRSHEGLSVDKAEFEKTDSNSMMLVRQPNCTTGTPHSVFLSYFKYSLAQNGTRLLVFQGVCGCACALVCMQFLYFLGF